MALRKQSASIIVDLIDWHVVRARLNDSPRTGLTRRVRGRFRVKKKIFLKKDRVSISFGELNGKKKKKEGKNEGQKRDDCRCCNFCDERQEQLQKDPNGKGGSFMKYRERQGK